MINDRFDIEMKNVWVVERAMTLGVRCEEVQYLGAQLNVKTCFLKRQQESKKPFKSNRKIITYDLNLVEIDHSP